MLLGCNGVDIHYSIMIIYAGYTEGVAVPPPPTPVLPVFRGPGAGGWGGGGGGGGGGAELPAGAQSGHRGGGGHRLPAVRAQAAARWLAKLLYYYILYCFH